MTPMTPPATMPHSAPAIVVRFQNRAQMTIGPKPAPKLRLSKEVERVGIFADQGYRNAGQQVKSGIERIFELTRPFGDPPNLSELPRKEGQNQARFGKIDRSDHNGFGMFDRHGGLVSAQRFPQSAKWARYSFL